MGVSGWEKDGPIVWVEKGVTLKGHDTFVVLPVNNDSGNDVDEGLMTQMQQQIVQALRNEGHNVIEHDYESKHDAIIVKTILLSYKTGDAVGRWFGFGAGAAKCTIRSTLIEASTDNVIAEVISTKVVDTGGLYSIGADARIADDVTKDISSAIINITQNGK